MKFIKNSSSNFGGIMKKKVKLKFFAIFLLSSISWLIWDNYRIQTSYFTVFNGKLPKSFDNYKIVHISDLHNRDYGNRLIDKVKNENPNLIVITGDLIDRNMTDIKKALKTVKNLSDISKVFYVIGNHECDLLEKKYNELIEGLKNLGVMVLENNNEEIFIGDQSIVINGLMDYNYEYIKNPALDKDEKLDKIAVVKSYLSSIFLDEKKFNILLAHHPEQLKLYSDYDLIFCGHVHGGQWIIPFFGGVFAPSQGFRPHYYKGIYNDYNTTMILSGGLGNSSSFPLRFNNPPNLVVVTLKTE